MKYFAGGDWSRKPSYSTAGHAVEMFEAILDVTLDLSLEVCYCIPHLSR
jgi:hypothetical protein